MKITYPSNDMVTITTQPIPQIILSGSNQRVKVAPKIDSKRV